MDEKMNVYIWDMDETLILLKSLLNGTYAEAYNGLKNVETGVDIGKMWENHILQVSDDYFFYEQIENFNQPYLDVLSHYDDGRDLSDYNFNQDGLRPPLDATTKQKLAYRHRVIAQRYKKGLYSFLNQDLINLWDNLYALSDNYTDRWLSSARACLELCVDPKSDMNPCLAPADARDANSQHVNVLVTSGPLIPSLVKCLFYRLDNLITCDNVYSSWDVGKLQCFSWIRERFHGPNVQFCVIGDGMEECEAAEAMRWPFVKIDPQPTSIHRFPGLTPIDLSHYLSVIYNTTDEETKKDA